MEIHKITLDNLLKSKLISALDYDFKVGYEYSKYLNLNVNFIKEKKWNFATIYDSQLLDLDFEQDGVESHDATNLFNAIRSLSIRNIIIVECGKLFSSNNTEAYKISNFDQTTIEYIKYIEYEYGFNDYILIFSDSLQFLALIPSLVDNLFIAGEMKFLNIACSDVGWTFNNLSK